MNEKSALKNIKKYFASGNYLMLIVGIVLIIVSVMYFIGKATILKSNSFTGVKVCMILCPLIGIGFIISAIISSLKTSKLLHTLKNKSSIMEIYYELNNEKTIKLKDDAIRLSNTYMFLKDEVEIIDYNNIVALYTHVEKNNEGNIVLAQVLMDTNDKKKIPLYTNKINQEEVLRIANMLNVKNPKACVMVAK